MNIVLIGMRGSGKTSVGKLLAKHLKVPFRELDAEVEELEGTSIQKMIEAHGWEYFRDRESEVVQNAAASEDSAVISAGGGIVMRSANIDAFKLNGALIVYLRTPLHLLMQRIGPDAAKLPRLSTKLSVAEDLGNVLEGRGPLYEKAADEIIDTEHLALEEVAEEIQNRLKNRENNLVEN